MACLRAQYSWIPTLAVLVFLSTSAAWRTVRAVEPKSRAKPKAKQAASAKPAELVADALRARADGNWEASRKILEAALDLAPDYPQARWENGEVLWKGRWLTLREFVDESAADKTLIDYAHQRDDYMRNVEAIVLNYPEGTAPPAEAPAYLKAPATATRYLRSPGIELPSRPASAHLQIFAVGNCEVYVNERHVLQSANERKRGATEIGKHLRAGKNVIAITSSARNKEVPGFYARLEGAFGNGRIFAVPSDLTWKVATDAVDGWKKPGFDDGNWQSVVASPVPLAAGRDEVMPNASPFLESALADWCKKNKLSEHSSFHRARQRLFSDQPLDVEVPPATEDAAAVARWKAVLQKIRADLDGDPTPRREAAARDRLRAADASAIVAFEEVLSQAGGPNAAPRFVLAFISEVLARLEDLRGADLLVRLAREAPVTDTRGAAIIEALKRHRPITFVPQLLLAMEEPYTVQTSVSISSNGESKCNVIYTRKGPAGDETRSEGISCTQYDTREKDTDSDKGGKGGASDKSREKDVINPEKSRLAAEAKAREIQARVAEQNRVIAANGERVIEILRLGLGDDRGPSPHSWWSWWQERNEIVIPPPKSTRVSSNTDAELVRANALAPKRKDCWSKGTPVWTTAGLRPIEEIKPGDLVLSRHADTGELAFKVVLASLAQPPAPMVTFRVGDDAFAASPTQRLWREGESWCMAKNIRTGDRLHGVGASLPVAGVQPAAEQAGWKLVVEGFNSFHVGRQAILAHDCGTPWLTTAPVPGLQP